MVIGLAILFILQVMAAVLIQCGKQRGVRSTGVLFIYWLLQLISAVLSLHTHARTVAAAVNCLHYSIILDLIKIIDVYIFSRFFFTNPTYYLLLCRDLDKS